MAQITASKGKIHNVTIKNQPAPNKRSIMDGSGTQSVGVKVHLDFTPSVDGVPADGPNDFVRSLKKSDGSPAFDLRWTVDGKLAWNSTEIEDPMELGSYDDADNGNTPTFVQRTQVGGGRHLVEVWQVIAAEDNGGKAVESNKVSWYCD